MRKWSVVALLVTGAVVLGATVFREQIARAAPPITQVFVTNDTSRPVPVQGTVTVQGTPSVNVVDAREPFEKRLDFDLDDGDFSDTASFTVPAGKRLVVEFMSARVTLPLGQTPSIFVNALSGALGYALPLEPQGVRATGVGTFNEFGTARDILEFADPEEFYDVLLERQPSSPGGNVSGSGSGSVYLSGYLLDE